MAKVSAEEVTTSQNLTKAYVLMAIQHDPHISVGSLIMALATCGVAAGVPRDNLAAVFDKTLDEVYAAAAKMGGKLN